MPKKRKAGFTLINISLISGWTFILVAVFIWNCLQIKEGVHNEAVTTLRMSVKNDHSFRAWATEHGGVYVPVTSTNPPNPYLAHVENNILSVSEKDDLTLLNPAYIMRQVYEVRMDHYGVYNRLTSFKAINPINKADPWEAAALEKFKENRELKEIVEIGCLNEEAVMRLMEPFLMRKGCLKCHAHQGFKLGDISGGISASLPLAPYIALIRSQQFGLVPGYVLIWLSGLAGIAWFIFQLKLFTYTLRKNEAQNRAMIEAIPDILFHYNADGKILEARIKEDFPVFSYFKTEDIVGRNIVEIFPDESTAKLTQAIIQVISSGKMQLIEHSFLTEGKRYFFEERLVLRDSNGNKEVISIVRDVTRQKASEVKLEYLSYHDELTGINNRNYFDSKIIEFNKSSNYPISIILADINGLKLVNDALGHVSGDKLLFHCARVLKQSLRTSDILARVGGDEFAAILPLTNQRQGQEIIKRIQSNILKHNQNFPLLPLSLSIGLATDDKNSPDLRDIYKEADDQMYQEKLALGARECRKIAEAIVSSLKNKDACPNVDYERLKDICEKMKINVG